MLTLLCATLLLAQQPDPPWLLRGQVLDGRAEPVPAAQVWVTAPGAAAPGLARACADGEGRFLLKVPGARSAVLHATASGFACSSASVTGARAGWRSTLTLWPGATVRGRVTDAGGAPVAGASVALVQARRMALPIDQVEARTDAEGRYQVAHAPLGAVWICAGAAGTVQVHREAWVGRDGDVDFVLPEGPRRSVTVSVHGVPAAQTAGWRVQLRRASFADHPQLDALCRGTLDAAGTWRVPFLPGDSVFSVLVTDPEQRWHCMGNVIRPHSGDRIEVGAFPSQRIEWSVTLVDPQGQPIAGERLLLGIDGCTREVITSAVGEASFAATCGEARFTAELIGSSRWVLAEYVHEELSEVDSRLVRRGTPPPILHARPAGTVRGRLVDEAGKARARTEVVLQERSRDPMQSWCDVGWCETDDRGVFAIAGLLDRGMPLRLCVPSRRSLVPVAGMQGAAEAPLADAMAAPAGCIAGTVLGSSGTPLSGARVLLLHDRPGGPRNSELLTDAEGRFCLPVAEPGRWRLGLFWPDSSRVEYLLQDVRVQGGEQVALAVRSARE